MKFSAKTVAIVLLFVALVLVNYLATSIPYRADFTAESIYSLSPGTKAILGKLEEPVTVDLYYSKDASGLPIVYKNYATRVQEMLRQYVRAGHGKLTLNVINPRPDTPEEEKATAAGLTPQVARTGGDQFFFGLVVTQADQQKTIAAFVPDREQFLEYDLTKLVYSVQQLDKRKLGVLTSLPLLGSNPQEAQMMAMMHQQPTEGQFIADEWKESFDLVTIESSATELPANLDALAVIHPENLSPKLQYAIDQFLLAGKPVFLCVDPSSQYFKRQAGQQAMFGGPQPNVSSDVPLLFKGYGLEYDVQKIVGDIENATEVRTQGGGSARYPIWLNLRQEGFSAKSLATAQLKSMLFVEAGSIALKPGSNLTFTPLVETSAQAGDLVAATLQFMQPDDVAGKITSSGKKTIAALITGKFKTAFPNGVPADDKPADKKSPPKKDTQPSTLSPQLSESKTTSTLLVVTDTDWLFDDYSVRKMNFFGQVAAEPFNDNLAFAANAVDFLAGSQDLVSIRGKGSSMRPFDVVRRMEVDAQKKYQDKLKDLETRLNSVQTKLTELQGKKGDGNKLLASPDVTKAIEEFQKQTATLRGERREIRRALREDVDALGNRLLVVNLLASPLLVFAFGLWFYNSRKK